MLRTLRTQVKWILVFFLLCFVLAIPLMYGVGGGGSDRGKNEDYAVAEIDGKKVMFSQLLRSVQSYVDQAGIRDITSTDLPMIHQMVLDQMVLQDALTKEVKNLGIKPSKEDLDKAVAEIVEQFPTKEAFQQYLAESGTTLEKLKTQLGEQLSERMLLEEASASASISDDELKELYESVKDFVFSSPSGIEVLAAEFSSREAAGKAYAELSGGTSWDVVMSGFSSGDLKGCTSSDNAAFIREEAITEKIAFVVSMDDGQYSEPVEMESDDFLVLYRRGFKDKETTSFEDAKVQLSSMVLNQKKQELQRAFLEQISSKISVKILDPSLFPDKTANPVVSDDASQDKNDEALSVDRATSPDDGASADSE